MDSVYIQGTQTSDYFTSPLDCLQHIQYADSCHTMLLNLYNCHDFKSLFFCILLIWGWLNPCLWNSWLLKQSKTILALETWLRVAIVLCVAGLPEHCPQ